MKTDYTQAHLHAALRWIETHVEKASDGVDGNLSGVVLVARALSESYGSVDPTSKYGASVKEVTQFGSFTPFILREAQRDREDIPGYLMKRGYVLIEDMRTEVSIRENLLKEALALFTLPQRGLMEAIMERKIAWQTKVHALFGLPMPKQKVIIAQPGDGGKE